VGPECIDKIDEDGRTALCEVAKEAHLDFLEFLLTQGAKVDKLNGGRTALGVASDFGRSLGIVVRLLEAGADPKKANKAGKTPIGLAQNARIRTANHPAIRGVLAGAAAVPSTSVLHRKTKSATSIEQRVSRTPCGMAKHFVTKYYTFRLTIAAKSI
jgi:hypothetical protein